MPINQSLIVAINRTIVEAEAPHGEVLDALMTVYAHVLMQFPCCFEGAEQHAEQVARLIAARRTEIANVAQAEAAQAILKAAGPGPAPQH